MKFRTEYNASPAPFTLDPSLPVALVGSCFSDNITQRMRRCLWDAGTPAGVLFNPLSIASALRLMLLQPDAESAYADTLFESGGMVHSRMFDSSMSATSRTVSTERFMAARARLHHLISNGRTLCVTFGTSYCYRLKGANPVVVANCHKQPAALFVRERLDTATIVDVWQKLMTDLRKLYTGLRFIFTVSPVRHVRDGLHENNLSKAILLLACEEICRGTADSHYFPAYEILNDDLRDYRFYASDLVHPSADSVEYVWEKFRETFLTERGREILREGEEIARRLAHRPILPDSEEARRFAARTAELLADFHARHPLTLLPDCLNYLSDGSAEKAERGGRGTGCPGGDEIYSRWQMGDVASNQWGRTRGEDHKAQSGCVVDFDGDFCTAGVADFDHIAGGNDTQGG